MGDVPPASEEAVNHTEDKKEEPEAAKEKEEEDEEDDPWVITKEQRKYYTTQFQNLQQDINLSIKGEGIHSYHHFFSSLFLFLALKVKLCHLP